MRTLRVVPAIALAVATALSTLAAASAAPLPHVARGAQVREYVCHGKHYKPKTILIACGDGNAFVRHLQWSKWTMHKARGSGVWRQNNCKPDCAGGHFVSYPVRMHLSQVIRRGQTKIFGRVVGVFPKRAPPYPAFKHHRILVMNHGKPAS